MTHHTEAVKAMARPLTAGDLADALGCFWNAALGAARHQQEGHAFAAILCEGIAAVQQRLAEIEATAIRKGE